MSLNRIGLGLLAFAAFIVPQALAGDCVCSKATAANPMYCTACGHGEVFGIKVASQKLFDSIAGVTVDAANSPCPGCKEAAKTNGTCSHCQVSLAGGRAYRSMAAHALAMGEIVTPDMKSKMSACPGCAKVGASGNGYCDQCKAGVVAGRMFKGKELYDAASSAFAMLTKAVEASKKCETCGVALATDGTCATCKVSYKNGEMKKV